MHYGPAMDYIDMLQWPAMVVTVARVVARRFAVEAQAHDRLLGVPREQRAVERSGAGTRSAYALIVLQFALAAMNVRGVYKNDPELEGHDRQGADQ